MIPPRIYLSTIKLLIFSFFCIFCRNIINTIVTQKQADLYDPPAYTSFSKYCYITIPFSAYKATTQNDIRQYGCVFHSRHCVILFASATFFIASYLVFFIYCPPCLLGISFFRLIFIRKLLGYIFFAFLPIVPQFGGKKEDRLRSSSITSMSTFLIYFLIPLFDTILFSI